MQTGQIKRVGNCWLLRYWETVIDNGKTVRRRKAKKLATYSREYRTEDDVRPLADVILAPINAHIAKPESTDTVLSFLENVYLKHVREAKKPSTAKSYTDMLKLVEPHLKLNQIKLRDFDTADADKLLHDVAKEKARAHTATKNLKSFLSGAFKYAKRNHAAFILIMAGFLLQWPTLVTLLMFPILVVVYVKLAHREEREVLTEFGNAYAQYAFLTPGFIPRWSVVVHRMAH